MYLSKLVVFAERWYNVREYIYVCLRKRKNLRKNAEKYERTFDVLLEIGVTYSGKL